MAGQLQLFAENGISKQYLQEVEDNLSQTRAAWNTDCERLNAYVAQQVARMQVQNVVNILCASNALSN